MEALFGGSSQSASSTPVDMQAPEFKALRDALADTLAKFAGGAGTGVPSAINAPPGPTAAQTAQEIAAMNDVNAQATDAARRGLITDTLSGKYLPGQEGANPFYDANLAATIRPVQQALNDTLSRTLPGTFVKAGQQIGGGLRSPNANLKPGSTAFDNAAARTFEAGANAISDIGTKIGFQTYDAERNRQTQAAALGQQEVDLAVKNFEAQQVPRLLKELGIERGTKAANDAINQWLQAMAIFAGVTAPAIANESESSGSVSPNLVGTILSPLRIGINR